MLSINPLGNSRADPVQERIKQTFDYVMSDAHRLENIAFQQTLDARTSTDPIDDCYPNQFSDNFAVNLSQLINLGPDSVTYVNPELTITDLDMQLTSLDP